jgi:antitoxin HicB
VSSGGTRKGRNKNAQVEAYLSAPYVRMLVPDAEEGGFSAEVLELPGCVSQGETAEEAYENLEDAMAGWLAASLAHNRPIPEPVGEKEFSGNFPLRMSTELHRAAARRAGYEGVSLNQWIMRAIAERVTGEDLADKICDRLAGRLEGGAASQRRSLSAQETRAAEGR